MSEEQKISSEDLNSGHSEWQFEKKHLLEYWKIITSEIKHFHELLEMALHDWQKEELKPEYHAGEEMRNAYEIRLEKLAHAIEWRFKTLSNIFLKLILLDLPEEEFPRHPMVDRMRVRQLLRDIRPNKILSEIVADNLDRDEPGVSHTAMSARKKLKNLQGDKLLREEKRPLSIFPATKELLDFRTTRNKILQTMGFDSEKIEQIHYALFSRYQGLVGYDRMHLHGKLLENGGKQKKSTTPKSRRPDTP